jgi:hypothetical protein
MPSLPWPASLKWSIMLCLTFIHPSTKLLFCTAYWLRMSFKYGNWPLILYF